MSKAEERAIEKYPVEMYKEVGWRCIDKNTYKRQYFIEGYQQAEKDLELSWKDMEAIQEIANDYTKYHTMESRFFVYKEVLKRFKDHKEREEK